MSSGKGKTTIGLVGNPNSGKSTVFNMLTGAKQHIGNWPGVTVERKEGSLSMPDGDQIEVVDLPGIYSLIPASEDEKVAVQYVLNGQADLLVNVIDGTNIERNLYLTLLLAELGVPILHVVTMMDIVASRRVEIDLKHLESHLGSTVIGIDATNRDSKTCLVEAIAEALRRPTRGSLRIEYPNEIEKEVETFAEVCAPLAAAQGVPPRWFGLRLLEGAPDALAAAVQSGATTQSKVSEAASRIRNVLNEYADEALAGSRYGVIQGLCHEVITKKAEKEFFSARFDRIVLNKWLGIPFFLLVMYMVFWATQVVGGAFIDFFDILGGAIFVDGTAAIMEWMGAPNVIVALVASGLGAGLQTMATFIPPIFMMFFCLSVLEDSGYMARAAFVMDRFMRWIGLPGKSFVPLLVGFGCSVPAIMATRTIESKRDRFLTIFMTPFMSCGAKLPVYVVFGAAFFANNPGKPIFLIYVSGIVLAVATGLLLKKTIFKGKPSHFIMELPPYHRPRFKHIMLHTWDRLKIFIFRAGKVIVPMVLLLGVLNTIGTDGTIGNDDSDKSVLSAAGVALTPIFEPMGVEKENWPATVAIFTGLFAKEAVIGTMTSLYGQNAGTTAEVDESGDEYSLWGGIKDAFASIPQGLSGIAAALADPLGFKDISGDEDTVADSMGTDASVFENMRKSFTKGPHQAFAYLLFILLYIPCLAAMGVAFRELGRFYGTVMMVYLTVLGWSVATLYYQITIGRQLLWIAVPAAMLLAMAASFKAMGYKRKIEFS